MPFESTIQSENTDSADSELSNTVTIVGRGVPSSYEISVNGQIDMVRAEPLEEATVISGGVAEGAIETGVLRFRFSGEMANVRLVDWNGVEAPESSNTPHVHVEYGTGNG